MILVVYQESGMYQGLLAAKGRLAKKGLTMLRLELISAHMAANLEDNVRSALEGYVVRSVYGWTDSAEQNPADVGIRGTLPRERLEIWLKGPNWPSKPEMWPAVVQTKPSKKTEA